MRRRSARDESEGGGRSGAAPYKYVMARGLLLGAASEEAEDDAGGDPIVVLMSIGAERGPVVIDIEQSDVDVPGWVDVQPAADLKRETALRSVVSAAPAEGGVCARSSDEGFGKRSKAPSISPTMEVARPVMISVENILGAADGYSVVAGVRDDLQPRFYVPTKRPHCAVYVGPSSASTVQACKRVAAKEFQQGRPSNTSGAGFLPARPRICRTNRWCRRFSRTGLS